MLDVEVDDAGNLGLLYGLVGVGGIDASIKRPDGEEQDEEGGEAINHLVHRPTKKRKLSINAHDPSSSVSTKPPALSNTKPQGSAPTQFISSLFTSNPVVAAPAPSAPAPRAGPSNAPLNTSSFSALGLDPLLTTHLRNKLSITAPTSIQRAALSSIISTDDSRDIFIQSQTGSGKTLAYLLPIIQDLLPLSTLSYIDRSIGTLAIIIAPTRELAKQISDVLELLLTLRLRPEGVNADGEPETDDAPTASARLTRWLVSGVLTGGATRTHEKARLRKGLPILVATPGRLLDHLQNTESFNVGKCRWLVLDEADRLMELGFEDSINGILKGLEGRRRLATAAAQEGLISATDVGGWDWERRRRTVLCSATIQEGVQRLAGEALQNPIIVKGSDPEPKTVTTANPENGTTPAAAPAKFTPPAQLAQKYITVPLKLRLVSLVALLRGIIAQAPTARGSRAGGTRIIVFLSCTDSVDYHWNLLGGVQMGGPTTNTTAPEEAESDADSSADDASESEHPSTSKAKAMGKGKEKETGKPKSTSPKKPSSSLASDVIHESPLLPHTKIFRLHGSLPLATRMASLKGFTADPKPPQFSTSAATSAPATPSSAILLCTSVASRGLDLPLVRAVVQYDLPTENGAAEYVHRVGRTARAGKGGEAWSFVAPSEVGWVPWIENSMNDEAKLTEDGEGAGKGGKGGRVKMESVGVPDVLRRGFGGGAGIEFEDRATQVQLSFEQWVLRSKEHTAQARKAFQSHIRAYSTHPSSEKHIFHVRNLHTGHLAKAFALRETPSGMGSSSGPSSSSSSKGKGKMWDSTRDSGRISLQKKLAAGSVPEMKGGGGGKSSKALALAAVEASKGKKRSAATMLGDSKSTEDRMREAVRSQGRLTKSGGAMVASGASEFQLMGGGALEAMAGRT
ncbi:DEAD-domain-containing protein [Clavulina sp. PMI_390]|nr:DEAD-domain-containing protein [Clavulina sp. PMI_390]